MTIGTCQTTSYAAVWITWTLQKSLFVFAKTGFCTPPTPRVTLVPSIKNMPNMRLKKNREIDYWLYMPATLTNFEYETHPRKRKYIMNRLKSAWKNSWNPIKWIYFWRVLVIWKLEPLRLSAPSGREFGQQTKNIWRRFCCLNGYLFFWLWKHVLLKLSVLEEDWKINLCVY